MFEGTEPMLREGVFPGLQARLEKDRAGRPRIGKRSGYRDWSGR